MALVAHSEGATVSRAAIVDPPMGMVTIELDKEEIALRLPDGEVDRLSRSVVRAMERDDCEVTVHWAGTPVLFAFGTSAESAWMFDELGGFDLDNRTYTILVSAAVSD